MLHHLPWSTNILWRISACESRFISSLAEWEIEKLTLSPCYNEEEASVLEEEPEAARALQAPSLCATNTKHSGLLVILEKAVTNETIKSRPKVRTRKAWKARTLSLPLEVTLRHGIQVRNVNINFSSAVTYFHSSSPSKLLPLPTPYITWDD